MNSPAGPMNHLFTVLSVLLPTCVCFGPFFLVLGICYRTSPHRTTHPKTTAACLLAGGAMITLALWGLYMKVFASK